MRILLALLLLITLAGHAQLTTAPTLPGISQPILYRQQPVKTHKPIMIAYKPRHIPLKITIKPMINRSGLSDINVAALDDFDISGAFDNVDFIGFGKFDVRIKFYIKKRTRVTLRALIQKNNSYNINCTAGVLFRV